MRRSTLPLMVFGYLTLAGCSATSASDPAGTGGLSGAGAGATAGSNGSGAVGGSSAGSGGSAGTGAPGSLGIVVVDVQETFVAGAKTADMAGLIERTKGIFQLAADQNVPFFVTFEASDEGDHALHAPLQPLLPAHAQQFVKTTFDATGQPVFSEAVKQSGLSHLVVLGAETDVCVMQTVLGLRTLGFTVMLEHDAVFSSETNTSPALRRMQQAGALLASQAEVAGYVADPTTLAQGEAAAVRRLAPLRVGVVLNDFSDASVAASADSLMLQKSARLRELLLVSEWFELPVYVSDPSAGLPQSFASYFQGTLRPISQIEQDAAVDQLVVAGTDGGLAAALSGWIGTHELFVMEDALLSPSPPAARQDLLKPLFEAGLVPISYKSFYYEMTQSVDLAQWPSQAWVDRFDEYYAITQAPEDLPPMPAS